MEKVCHIHHVKTLYLFGSAAKETFNSESDLDFMVQFSTTLELLNYADNFFSLIESLEALFQRRVDLLSVSSVKNPVLKEEIDKTKVMLYVAWHGAQIRRRISGLGDYPERHPVLRKELQEIENR
ncbi:MAG: nucleotidyltransferase domain-containing protein [Imperialibacter sp.]